jgi:hypothetical protein
MKEFPVDLETFNEIIEKDRLILLKLNTSTIFLRNINAVFCQDPGDLASHLF